MGEMLSTSSINEQAEAVATCLAGFRPGACLSDLRFLSRAHPSLQPLLREAEELVEMVGPEPGLSVRGRIGKRLLALSDRFLEQSAELGMLSPDTVAELQSDPGEGEAEVA
ncbi:MAG: hypothetical protein ACYC3S_09800 [Chloroflexota bacterium]